MSERVENVRIAWALLAFLSLPLVAPPARAQVPDPSVWASLAMDVETNETAFDPLGAARAHAVDLHVTCGTAHADAPNYSVDLVARDAPTNLTVTFLTSTVGFAFDAADCVEGGTNGTQTEVTSFTLRFPAEVAAFTRGEFVLNATLKRSTGGPVNGTDPLDYVETTVALVQGYVAALTGDAAITQISLAQDQATFEVTLQNRANGATRVTPSVLNASATLTVTLPEPLDMARSASQVVQVRIAAASGCAELARAATVRFAGASTDPRGTAISNADLTLTVRCEKGGGGSPGPEAMIVVSLFVAFAWLRRRT